MLVEGKKFISCNTFKRQTYSSPKQHTIMPILNSQPLCCLILLIPYPSNSKSFSPSQANAIALHYPTNTHHILPIYYTIPSHNPCIFNISNTMLLLILVKITYLLKAQIPQTQHNSFKRKSQITRIMWNLHPRVRWISTMQESVGGNSFHAIHLKEKHIQHQNFTRSCQS